jgi:16S rRNA G966 N2-methylase RsmD
MRIELVNHIDGPLPTAGHTPMYNMHKFFARKQEDVIRAYIEKYSEEGEIVLDPFCGSGVMVGEALRLGRRAVGVDINPVAIFISRNTIRYVDPDRIKEEFNQIKADIGDQIDSLYMTKCRECKDTIIPAICFTWNDKRLDDVRYECPYHGKQIKPVDKYDLELYDDIEKGNSGYFFDSTGKCRFWYPINGFYYRDGTPFLKKERFNSVDGLFTKRNLVALACLRDRIERIKEEDLRESFKFAFSSMTHLATRMTPVRPTRPYSSAWVQQSYWYCENNMESNVWDLFRRAVKDRQSLINAKEDLPGHFKSLREATGFKDLIGESRRHFLLARSAIDALDDLEENSIDYVITDPPYGHSIQYAELLYMWGCWLKLMDGFDEIAKGEIVENPKQNKSDEDYENMLYVAFTKIFKVLKPGRYCTITFHNPDLKYRNILFRSVVLSGFEFEKIIYQPAPRGSAKSPLQPFGSLVGDYFFRFRKPADGKSESYEAIDQKRVEKLIVGIAERIIAERGEPTHYTFIQNSIDPILYQELRKYGLLMDFQPQSVETILKKYLGKVFKLVDMEVGRQGQKSLLGKGWWFVDPNQHRLDIPLVKRLDEAIVNLLRKNRKVTFTEVLTEIYTRFQNSLTPEEDTILDILKENADPVKGGKWEIKAFVRNIQERHEEIVYYLARIGTMTGYKVDIAKDEYGKKYDGKALESILPLSSLSGKSLTEDQMNRIRSIDVIWHDTDEVIAEFEVEHSTSIVDAVVRGSNITTPSVNRLIVIPEKREDLVWRRFGEPAMQEIMKGMDWKIITYETLQNYYNQNERKKKIDPDEVFTIARKPMGKREKEAQGQARLI